MKTATRRPTTAGARSGGSLVTKPITVPVAPAAVVPPIHAQKRAAKRSRPRTAPNFHPRQISQIRKTVAPMKMYLCHSGEPSRSMATYNEEAAQEINPTPLPAGGESSQAVASATATSFVSSRSVEFVAAAGGSCSSRPVNFTLRSLLMPRSSMVTP